MPRQGSLGGERRGLGVPPEPYVRQPSCRKGKQKVKNMSGTIHFKQTWQGADELEDLFWSPEIVRTGDGVSLTDHCVVADENGDAVETFMGYADTAFEEITSTTWVRKTFAIDNAALGQATICLAGDKRRGNGKLAGTFNGIPFTAPARHNCRPWYSDWTLIPVPGKLRRGTNELILHTTGTLAWRLFVVPCLLPNRSARSADAGLTWDDAHLGTGRFIDGEYCIRLSGQQTAPSGTVTSAPIQVKTNTVAAAGRVTQLAVKTDGKAAIEIRLGSGPWTDRPGVWTAWQAPGPATARQLEAGFDVPGPRFVQFRASLTAAHGRAPTLRSVKFEATLEPAAAAVESAIAISGPPTVLSGRHFAHQRTSEKLAYLRQAFELDAVFETGSDTWDSLLRLAAWVGAYASHRHQDVKLIPKHIYETHSMLVLGHAKQTPVYCGGLAFMLVQLAAAFGLTGRVIFRGNHLVTEFWSPLHRKWAVVDPMDQLPDPQTGVVKVWTEGFGGYYTHADGVPLSAIELGVARGRVTRRHFVYSTGCYEERPATIARDLQWFRREISYPERNNHTDVAEPLFRGDVFRYAGYLKYRQANQSAVPWYPKYTARRGDIEWTVGETSVFLTALPNGQVLVQLRSQLPNTVTYELGGLGNLAGDTCRIAPSDLGSLNVRAVNALGQPGPVTSCSTTA
jgi:hypothetical protein